MQTKTSPDEIESFLSDASFIREGHAERVVLPENVEDVSEILASANRERVPVTVSGAGRFLYRKGAVQRGRSLRILFRIV